MSQSTLEILSTIILVVGALSVIFIRLKAAKKPTSVKKIIMPPLGMATGFLMFIFPIVRIPISYAIVAFLVGCLFSIPLILTSHMDLREAQIYLKRSPAFILVLVALLILRLALHSYIAKFITLPQTGAIFFLLAFGMLLPWRIVMYMRFKSFQEKHRHLLFPSQSNA